MHASLFTCPACEMLFQSPAPGQKCLCPRCGQKLQIPEAPAGLASPAVPPAPGHTILAAPARIFALDPTRLLRLRVWAADVRDRVGAHAGTSVEAAGLAKTLCELLDARENLQADNARDVLNGNIALIVGFLILAGIRGP